MRTADLGVFVLHLFFARKPKVKDFNLFALNHHVLKLEVSMDHASAVHMVDRKQYLLNKPAYLAFRNALAFCQEW